MTNVLIILSVIAAVPFALLLLDRIGRRRDAGSHGDSR